MSKSNLIFPEADNRALWHNIVGKGGLLGTATVEVQNKVGPHYTCRGADHADWGMVYAPDEYAEQIYYRNSVIDGGLTQGDRLKNEGSWLVVPYIRLEDVIPDGGDGKKIRHYGFHPRITGELNNKVRAHSEMVQHNPEFVPNYKVVTPETIKGDGLEMVREIAKMYELAEMDDEYEVGLMLRAAESNGNYGALKLRRACQDEVLSWKEDKENKTVKVNAGQIVAYPDGKMAGLQVFDDWVGDDGKEGALDFAERFFPEKMDMSKENRIIAQRLLDVKGSPGRAVFVVDNQTYWLNPNYNYFAPGESASTGNMTGNGRVDPRVDMNFGLQRLENQMERMIGRSQENHVYASGSADTMILGDKERELHTRAFKNPKLKDYLDNVGRINEDYEPRIYDPKYPLYAENNPRLTNFTLNLIAVATARGMELTPENLQELARGEYVRSLARDYWRLPDRVQGNNNVDLLRDEALEFHHQKLRGEDAGLIIRMPDSPEAGVIVYGPKDYQGLNGTYRNGPGPERVLDDAYDYLSQPVVRI